MGTLVRGIGVQDCVTLSFCSAKVCSPAILETCFSYYKDIWIGVNGYYMYLYIIVLFPLKSFSS